MTLPAPHDHYRPRPTPRDLECSRRWPRRPRRHAAAPAVHRRPSGSVPKTHSSSSSSSRVGPPRRLTPHKENDLLGLVSPKPCSTLGPGLCVCVVHEAEATHRHEVQEARLEAEARRTAGQADTTRLEGLLATEASRSQSWRARCTEAEADLRSVQEQCERQTIDLEEARLVAATHSRQVATLAAHVSQFETGLSDARDQVLRMTAAHDAVRDMVAEAMANQAEWRASVSLQDVAEPSPLDTTQAEGDSAAADAAEEVRARLVAREAEVASLRVALQSTQQSLAETRATVVTSEQARANAVQQLAVATRRFKRATRGVHDTGLADSDTCMGVDATTGCDTGFDTSSGSPPGSPRQQPDSSLRVSPPPPDEQPQPSPPPPGSPAATVSAPSPTATSPSLAPPVTRPEQPGSPDPSGVRAPPLDQVTLGSTQTEPKDDPSPMVSSPTDPSEPADCSNSVSSGDTVCDEGRTRPDSQVSEQALEQQ